MYKLEFHIFIIISIFMVRITIWLEEALKEKNYYQRNEFLIKRSHDARTRNIKLYWSWLLVFNKLTIQFGMEQQYIYIFCIHIYKNLNSTIELA